MGRGITCEEVTGKEVIHTEIQSGRKKPSDSLCWQVQSLKKAADQCLGEGVMSNEVQVRTTPAGGIIGGRAGPAQAQVCQTLTFSSLLVSLKEKRKKTFLSSTWLLSFAKLGEK